MENNTMILIFGVIIYILINLGFARLISKFNSNLLFGRIFWSCLVLSPIFGALIAIIDILTFNFNTRKESDKESV